MRYASVSNTLKFVVLDLNPEGLDLLGRTLSRKFPGCTVTTTSSLEDAQTIANCEETDAIIVHRPIGGTGEDAVRQLRKEHPHTPIVQISSVDRRATAMAAGASAFLLYDEWLLLGGVISDLIQEEKNPGKA